MVYGNCFVYNKAFFVPCAGVNSANVAQTTKVDRTFFMTVDIMLAQGSLSEQTPNCYFVYMQQRIGLSFVSCSWFTIASILRMRKGYLASPTFTY